MTSKWKAQGKRLADDLLCLEVSVLTATGDRGPVPDDLDAAVRSIAVDYCDWLHDVAPVLDGAWNRSGDGDGRADGDDDDEERGEAPDPGSVSPPAAGQLAGSLPSVPEAATVDPVELLSALERGAATAEHVTHILVRRGEIDDEGRGAVARRIRGNAALLSAVMSDEIDGLADRTRIVSKAWELGTHTIATQSVTQLDGDVIVRLDSTAASTAGGAIRNVHVHATAQAIGHWQVLFGFVVELTRSAASTITAVRRGSRNAVRAAVAYLRGALERATGRGAESADDPTPPPPDGDDGEQAGERRSREKLLAGLQRLRQELISDGGAMLVSRSPDNAAAVARTLIQVDGDALWAITPAAWDDPSLLERHRAVVEGWYDDSGELVARLRRRVTRVLAASGSVVGVVFTYLSAKTIELSWSSALLLPLTGAAVAAAVAAISGAISGRVLRGFRAKRFV